MNLDMTSYHRKVYTIVDLISDIGGLIIGLGLLFFLLIRIVKLNEMEFYLISKLYTKHELSVNSENDSEVKITENLEDSSLDRNGVNLFKLNLLCSVVF